VLFRSDTPWADCFTDFFSTHVTAMPFSMMVGMMSVARMGILARYPNLRCAFLEIGATWFPYWAWWVGKHIEHVRGPRGDGRHEGNWGRDPYTLPETIREPMEDILAGRILSGFEDDENLRAVIDQVGAGSLMYASDYPHSDMDWGRVAAIKNNDSITREERAALLGGNAQRFYKLDSP